MTEQQRFESLMKLAEFRMGIREARRSYEWRVSLALWLGMAAGLISLKGVPLGLLITALILVVICYSWLWIRWNWIAGERDARLAYFYAESAEALLSIRGSPEPDRRRLTQPEGLYGFVAHGPPVFQILATVLLAVGLAFFASRPTEPIAPGCTCQQTTTQSPQAH